MVDNPDFDLDDVINQIENGGDDIPEAPEAPEVEEDPIASHEPQLIQIDVGDIDDAAPSGQPSDAVAKLTDEIISQFGDKIGQIWNKLQVDREQLDHYIGIFTDRIVDHESTKTCYVEALTTLLTTKASTSINASKLLDSIAKMTGVIKNIKIENTDVGGLNALLDESVPDNEGFDPNAP